MEPNRERIAEWVAELRSGKYTQIQKRLKSPEGHCCMGVACEIYAKHHNMTFSQVMELVSHHANVLPQPVAEWFGFSNYNPIFKFEGEWRSAGHLNDVGKGRAFEGPGVPFNSIADAIEQTYLNEDTRKVS